MKTYNPSHPGEVLQGLWLEPMAISISRATQALGVSRKTLSKIFKAVVR
ncbi:MAG: helix-turn-helix transcriptional regulator [Burkholderiales bacterium]